MWSLYHKKGEDSIFLESFSGEKLAPLKFSNNKTQEDVVKEILEAIEQGNKVIFIRGKCGTGKSAIALNLARHFKKTSIVVPIKSLQEQYEQDYSEKKFILKKDNKKLKIAVIKGRNNFRCKFNGERADDPFLPCTIELREKNFEQIKRFVELNKAVSKYDFNSISDVRRMSVAASCPFWSPLLPSDLNSKSLEEARKIRYQTISGKEYALYQRQKGCPYYEQYIAYSEADVLIFNSLKYIIESAMGRRPRTDLDIIDECDEFLDSFAEENSINLSRLSFALSTVSPKEKEDREILRKINEKVNSLMIDYSQPEVDKLKNTEIYGLIDQVLGNPSLAEDDEDNYYNKVLEISRTYEQFLDEAYVSFKKEFKEGRESAYISIVTINLAQRLREIVSNTHALVLMSGTLHSEQVLKDIFGLDKFKIIEAETQSPGHIIKRPTGKEINCKYENFKNKIVTRCEYLEALSACVTNAKPPTLIHVNSFEDLPTELEKAEFKLNNLITRERLLEIQNKDRSNIQVEKFKSKQIDILFTTKCSRGIDFPGEQCNSIILTKYPYPNIKSLFWQILKKEKPEKFTEFYMDKAKRELLQKIYRGVRFKDDYVILLSPDSRVLNANLN